MSYIESSRRGLNTQKKLFFLRMLILIMFIGLSLFSVLGQAEAHAVLERTTPLVNDEVAESPESVIIIFNEKLDDGGSRLLVLNERSRNVVKGKPESIEEGKGIKIDLPRLQDGHYTVSYSVISADGHPITGAYVFSVGNPAAQSDSESLDPHQQVGHGSHESTGLTFQTFLLYASRSLYYAALLALSGLVLWSLLLQRQPSELARMINRQAIELAGKFMLLATLTYVFFSLQDLGQGEPLSEWGRILTDTSIGRLYMVLLLLALVATTLSKLEVLLRVFWVPIALLAEAWSGHAAALDSLTYMIAIDGLHLLAAALWSGGLVLLMAIWFKERTEAGRFAMLFSKWALLSFLVLWVTGVLATMEFIPSLDYLLYTAWGKWLIAKAAISLLVVITAMLIRMRMRKGELPKGNLLKLDVGLLLAIVLTVGILTYQSPLPANEPIHFHKMGTEMHVTLRVSPNSPGDNIFTLKVWLPEEIGLGVPKKVQLRLIPTKRDDIGFIDVPLVAYEDEEQDGFPGFAKSTYRAKGPFLPFPGEWKAQIRVTDTLDEERIIETTTRIY